MAIKAASRLPARTDTSVFKRLGRGNPYNVARNNQINNVVCKYWLEGRCSRNPCRFLHPGSTKPQPKQSHPPNKANGYTDKSNYSWKNPDVRNSKKSPPTQRSQHTVLKSEVDASQIQSQRSQQTVSESEVDASQIQSQRSQQTVLQSEIDASQRSQQTVLESEVDDAQIQSIPKTQKLCSYWVTNSCVKGDNCENMHSWSHGNGLSMVARLEGQSKAVTGIVLPSGSDKLYCGSKDKSLRIWDCNSGKCGAVVDLGLECETLINEDPWIFAGLKDTIKAWNLRARCELTLRAPGGKVNAITMFNNLLFAGMEVGDILAWKSTSETGFCELPLASLKGHTGAVLSLVVGAGNLYSGSADHSIRVWDPESQQCMHVLNGHTDDVTTLLCWDSYLLSGSLDKKIKCWAATENDKIEEVYQHNVDDGVLAFCGMHDAEEKAALLCSCTDSTVRLYNLPSFNERGRTFSRQEVRAIQVGPGGLFFTGDATGLVSVWKLSQDPVRESNLESRSM